MKLKSRIIKIEDLNQWLKAVGFKEPFAIVSINSSNIYCGKTKLGSNPDEAYDNVKELIRIHSAVWNSIQRNFNVNEIEDLGKFLKTYDILYTGEPTGYDPSFNGNFDYWQRGPQKLQGVWIDEAAELSEKPTWAYDHFVKLNALVQSGKITIVSTPSGKMPFGR